VVDVSIKKEKTAEEALQDIRKNLLYAIKVRRSWHAQPSLLACAAVSLGMRSRRSWHAQPSLLACAAVALGMRSRRSWHAEQTIKIALISRKRFATPRVHLLHGDGRCNSKHTSVCMRLEEDQHDLSTCVSAIVSFIPPVHRNTQLHAPVSGIVIYITPACHEYWAALHDLKNSWFRCSCGSI
jgi:hypothetical protein